MNALRYPDRQSPPPVYVRPMNVKAQGLFNAARHIEDTFGREALGEILRACSAPVRETYTTSVAIHWHPASELCEFVDVAESMLGRVGKLAQEIGAAGARANMKGTLLRIAMYWGKPDYLMKRVAGLWRQYNDEGTMEFLSMGTEDARMEVKGVPALPATFCRILTGWWVEVAIGLGGKHVTGSHPECRALGAPRCVWELHGRVDEAGLGVRPKA